MMRHFPLFIDGVAIEEGGDGSQETRDPASGETFATFAVANEQQTDQAVAAARRSFEEGVWRGLKPFERGRVLFEVASELSRHRDEIAQLLVQDSGKPLRDAYWEVDCSARFFEYYAGTCDKPSGHSVPLGEGWMDWTVLEPIGVSAHIVPWNYPLQVAIRGIAPALAAGCSVVAKPSTETPAALEPLARACRKGGVPPGVMNIVTGPGSTVGDRLARHEGVDQLTFTGSVSTGIKVLQAAATHAIPTTMELGGKSPQLVFADADFDRVLPVIAGGMYTHAGQVCNAGTRLLAQENVHDQVVDRLHGMISSMSLGKGRDNPDMGPLVSADQKKGVEEYLEIAEEEGTVLTGSPVPDTPPLDGGYFVSPSLVTGIDNSCRVAQEEIFGPVLSVVPFGTVDEAIAIANDSEFGLVAGVFTGSIDTAMRCAQDVRAGQVWINAFSVALDVEFPFGGYKRSGFGREKGLEALAAYQQIKNVCTGF